MDQVDADYAHREKNYMGIAQECCTATYFPSLKSSKLDRQNMQDTAGEEETSS